MNKSYWIKCIHSYEIDGKEFWKGHMKYCEKGCRFPQSGYWELATDEDMKNMESHKGIYYTQS